MPVDDYQNAAYKDTDNRGRITLGQEYADSTVAVAWTELPEPDPEYLERPSDKEREKLSALWKWAAENGYAALDYDVENGRVYTGDAEWVDTDVVGLSEEDANE